MTHQTQKLSASKAIGASTAEEINPKSTDRAPAEKGRIRWPGGGGRKKLAQKDSRIIPAIEEIISEHTIGDPQDKSKWRVSYGYIEPLW